VTWLPCPYLGGEVELTEERQRHISLQHPDLWPAHSELVGLTALAPDSVQARAWAPGELLLVRRFDDLPGEPHIVVVVVLGEPPNDVDPPRNWIVTAYLSYEDSVPGDVIWQAN